MDVDQAHGYAAIPLLRSAAGRRTDTDGQDAGPDEEEARRRSEMQMLVDLLIPLHGADGRDSGPEDEEARRRSRILAFCYPNE